MTIHLDEQHEPGSVADYCIVSPLGVGGHGRFYLATPPARLGLDTDHVALKVVPGGDSTAFRRFSRELRLFARVDSVHLVKLYDAGQHEDRFFYSMEFCENGSLESPAEPLSRPMRRRAVADAARAAHALHEAGIAHRDLRPSNVLLRSGDRSACIGDLGLAMLGGGSVTAMAPIASVGFVDPALLIGGVAGRASDIYSLGAILHYVLTGRHLYPGVEGSDPMLAVRAILRRASHVHRDELDGGEAEIIAACVDRDVDGRPATAADLAQLIDGLGGE